MTANGPSDPIDLNYELGIRVAHNLGRERRALIQFLAGLVSEMAAGNDSAEPEQLRIVHGVLLALVASKFRQALLHGEDTRDLERQLGPVLAAAYRDQIKKQGESGPPRPGR